MEGLLEKLFFQYNSLSNNKIDLLDKIDLILSKFAINSDLPIFYIGILNDFIVNEPQYYYNKTVENEVLNNLNDLYDKDTDMFLIAFHTYQEKFFYSLNSYYSILDLYNEFDDIGLENVTKAKIYYIPLITQLMEFCLNHFYRGLASIEGCFKNKDYTTQNTLGKLKNVLKNSYPNLLNIDIDFRDAISHGMVEISNESLHYSYTERETRETVFKELKHYDLETKKNELIDIASGALIGLFKFMTAKEIITNEYLSSMDEKTSFEFFKLFLHNENIRVKSYSTGIIGSSQFNIHIDIKNINDKDKLIHIFVLIGKIMYISFPNYERYFISYNHPYSISGMISFEKTQLKKMLFEDDISKLDKIIGSDDSTTLIPDIQNNLQDNRSYKFHTFPRISGENWEISDLRDISAEGIKRFRARLIIDNETISKKEIEKLLFQASKKIRVLENKSNPQSKIKHGKIEADLVRIEVFYKMYERGRFALLQNNDNFICLVYYYKSRSVPKIEVPFQNNYNFENLKKFDIYWSKGFNI